VLPCLEKGKETESQQGLLQGTEFEFTVTQCYIRVPSRNRDSGPSLVIPMYIGRQAKSNKLNQQKLSKT